jgi:hypothetical protein
MKLVRLVLLSCAPSLLLALAGCSSDMNVNTGANANAAASPTPAVQALTQAERPQKVKDQMAQRGEQDTATPALKIVEPKEGATVNGSTVKLNLSLAGDLKGYEPHKDPATGMGNHIHVILDNQPYEAYYNLHEPFELRNVAEGAHTIRVFGNKMADESGADKKVISPIRPQSQANSNRPAADSTPIPTPEGKDMPASVGGAVDKSKPLLTYSRPKGEYKGADADAIMLDFWLTNAKLQGDGGEYRVRYSVDGGEAKYIDKWEPIWLSGWTAGKHTVRLELIDRAGNPVDNGGYNTTSRDITVTK